MQVSEESLVEFMLPAPDRGKNRGSDIVTCPKRAGWRTRIYASHVNPGLAMPLTPQTDNYAGFFVYSDLFFQPLPPLGFVFLLLFGLVWGGEQRFKPDLLVQSHRRLRQEV